MQKEYCAAFQKYGRKHRTRKEVKNFQPCRRSSTGWANAMHILKDDYSLTGGSILLGWDCTVMGCFQLCSISCPEPCGKVGYNPFNK